ncbi:AraC family transcriptional regulator N-terminal domain-containing protein [Vibrio sp. WXL103]|uniref:AraC family transcriptional regulator n=1 Tax=Vibrio sp. WXL103 TaxID=3450710 RepID=UPI003EC8EB50
MINGRYQQFELFRQEYGLRGKLGFCETHIPGVNFFWSEESIDFSSMVYPSGIAFIRNGAKTGVFANQRFRYDADHFLLVTVSTPLICKTIAEPQNPVFGIFLQSDSAQIRQMVMDMGGESALPTSRTRGVEPIRIGANLENALERLMNALLSATDSKVIGEALLKEVIYRVLQSPHAQALYSAMLLNTSEHKMASVIDYIKKHYAQRLSVADLAAMSAMSSSHFHREFKNITGSSPIQFIKRIRLSRARSLIVHDNCRSNIAADKVGYRNLSQFSRDFKLYFGVTPTKASQTGYAEIDIWPDEGPVELSEQPRAPSHTSAP